MGRERTEFKRSNFKRELHRLFIIATEGSNTEKKYFEALLDNDIIKKDKIYLEVIPSKSGKSSPKAVIYQLDSFKSIYYLYEDDELWMVIDRDKQSWSEAQLSEISRLCNQKKYYFVVNNPCFEIWPLLHLADLSEYSEKSKIELNENRKVNKNRNRVEKEILDICGSYKKRNPNFKTYIPKTDYAVINSKKLCPGNKPRWTNELGTYLHLLIDKLIQ